MSKLKASPTNTSNQRELYHREGLFYVDGLFPEALVESWAEEILRGASGKSRVTRESEEQDPCRVYSEGADYKVLDGVETEENPVLRSMYDHYHTLCPWLSAITHRDIVTSKYPRSAINCKLYPALGGHQEWHYDTNGLTFLLYLSENLSGEGGTEAFPLTARRPMGKDVPNRFEGESVIVEPRLGRVLVMNGREVWHRSLPTGPKFKISCPWNYYERGDTWRPEGFDAHTSGEVV